MIWMIVNFCICLFVGAYTFYTVRKARVDVEKAHATNLVNTQEEYAAKKKILEDLAVAAQGLISEAEVEAFKASLVDFENQINTERGKCAVAEAELDALDVRLRELEELRRELEVSNMDAIKEVEMLRTQERDISNQNEAINAQLQSSVEQIDILLDVLHANVGAVTQLNKTRNEMIQTEKSIAYYEEEIAKINQQYVGLKRAYDALDIEYAQLYKKGSWKQRIRLHVEIEFEWKKIRVRAWHTLLAPHLKASSAESMRALTLILAICNEY